MSGRQTAFHLETRSPSVSEQHPNHCRVESCFSSKPSDGSYLGKDVAIAMQGQQHVAAYVMNMDASLNDSPGMRTSRPNLENCPAA